MTMQNAQNQNYEQILIDIVRDPFHLERVNLFVRPTWW